MGQFAGNFAGMETISPNTDDNPMIILTHPECLASNPAYWRGCAWTRQQFADHPQPGEDPMPHHIAAAEYEAKAAELAKWRTP